MAEQFSWVPLPSCSPPGRPFPVKSLALSAHGSPQTIHFRVLDKSPLALAGASPSCNNALAHGSQTSASTPGSSCYLRPGPTPTPAFAEPPPLYPSSTPCSIVARLAGSSSIFRASNVRSLRTRTSSCPFDAISSILVEAAPASHLNDHKMS